MSAKYMNNLFKAFIAIISATQQEVGQIPPPFKEHFASVSKVRVRYFDEGLGPAILLIHGFGVNAETWRRNIPTLSSRYRVLAPDLIGHGKSDRPQDAPYSMTYFVETFQSFLSQLEIKEYVAIGHSMGGRLALRLASSDISAKAKALVLEDSAGLGGGPSFRRRMAFLSYLIRMNLLGPSEKRVRGWLGKGFYSDPSKISDDSVNRALEAWSDPDYRRMQRKIAVWFRRGEAEASWLNGTISLPTLIIWGAEDRQIPARVAVNAAERIQNCKVEVIPKCGHTPHSECSEEFNSRVVTFLNKLQ